jgi:hypothetical protein
MADTINSALKAAEEKANELKEQARAKVVEHTENLNAEGNKMKRDLTAFTNRLLPQQQPTQAAGNKRRRNNKTFKSKSRRRNSKSKSRKGTKGRKSRKTIKRVRFSLRHKYSKRK